MRHLLGIDHGRSGYLCLYDAKLSKVMLAKMPLANGALSYRCLHTAKDHAKKDYDVVAMLSLVQQAKESAGGDLTVVMEDTLVNFTGGGGRSRSSLQDLARSRGIWETVCGIAGVPLYRLSAASWKARMGLTGKSKEYSLEIAQAMRPGEAFPSHDAADAFLIAYVFSTYELK